MTHTLQKARPSSVHLLGNKPLSDPMLAYCSSGPCNQVSVKFQSLCSNKIHIRKCILKCSPCNGGYFFSAALWLKDNTPCFKSQIKVQLPWFNCIKREKYLGYSHCIDILPMHPCFGCYLCKSSNIMWSLGYRLYTPYVLMFSVYYSTV